MISGGISASLGKIIPIFVPEGQNDTHFLPMDPKIVAPFFIDPSYI
jgi:hypothetical protein